jgi:hypothetical protein
MNFKPSAFAIVKQRKPVGDGHCPGEDAENAESQISSGEEPISLTIAAAQQAMKSSSED